MKVLGLCSYPIEAAATRYRLTQFIEPLAREGISLTISPFLDSRQFGDFYKNKGIAEKSLGLWKPLVRRAREISQTRDYDLLFVQREAAFFGPAFFEWVFRHRGKSPMILDLDDATYVRYVSPTYGRIGSFFKFFGKTDALIESSAAVTCGNRFIAEYVEKKGVPTTIVPTVVSTDEFFPLENKNNETPVIGWIGTHSTFPFLQSLFPVFQKLAERHDFVLRIVGAGRDRIELDGVKIENVEWNLAREISDFQTLDVGLYPIKTSSSANEAWLQGKSGFKAIQYMAVGVPFVMTPIGVCAEIGEPGRTHFNAGSDEEWFAALDKMLADKELRHRMGANGRRHSLANYTVDAQTKTLAALFRRTAGRN